MALGQLPGDTGAPRAENPGGVVERREQTVRRLEPDERLGSVGKACERPAALSRPRRKEPREIVGNRGQPRDGKCRSRSGRARDDLDRVASGGGGLDELRARV